MYKPSVSKKVQIANIMSMAIGLGREGFSVYPEARRHFVGMEILVDDEEELKELDKLVQNYRNYYDRVETKSDFTRDGDRFYSVRIIMNRCE